MKNGCIKTGPLATLASFVGLLGPGVASACAVCMGGTADNRIEFILTTALLTFLPLGLIGSIVYGLRRRYLSLAQQPPSDTVPSVRSAPESASVTSIS
jgi:hypothetical protein